MAILSVPADEYSPVLQPAVDVVRSIEVGRNAPHALTVKVLLDEHVSLRLHPTQGVYGVFSEVDRDIENRPVLPQCAEAAKL
eukprot:4166627-Prorocentrum_lima.AAC.1